MVGRRSALCGRIPVQRIHVVADDADLSRLIKWLQRIFLAAVGLSSCKNLSRNLASILQDSCKVLGSVSISKSEAA
jgi:hypothetical protein